MRLLCMMVSKAKNERSLAVPGKELSPREIEGGPTLHFQWNPTSLFLQPMSLMQMLDTADRVFPSMEATSTDGLRNRTPWDIVEEENCFKLRMDMPGINKNDVKLSVEDGELLVRAEHVVEEGEDDWSARSHGSYSGRIDLPETVDVGNIKAEMKDGVLKILAPKVEVVKQKHEVHVE
ncbi:hypothetical protein KP509_14G068700 [Ceratopteris richardii]|uniref:SHSP domain-containing protein n=1 Tax=Ceratopteris richardii TaxID=49495 RepID=A0A8T2T8X6_CERRI|nr:hypothetical protein KP509_14G068700 [Ceratopteris richardii]